MKEEGSEERESGDEFLRRLKEDHEPRIALSTVTRHEDLLRLESQHEQLLPGLSNEIVLDLIAPKLPWREFGSLLSVSRCWKQAIQSHQVYDARVRSHSTETLLVLNHIPPLDEMAWREFGSDDALSLCSVRGSDDALSLYSVRDKSWLQLPPIPHRHRGLPDKSKFISLDGKIYVLGGFTGPYYLFHDDWRVNRDSREVYVLDVAGQSGWKQCASMLEPRWNFGCGVINGKIYVFGGTCRGEHTRGSEVYNPKENAWSVVAPMKSMRFGPHCNVVTVGEELFVHGGNFYGTNFDLEKRDDSDPLPEEDKSDGEQEAWFAEVYHPGRDEWKLVTPFKFCAEGGLFTAHGKIYRMTHCGIDVCHFEGDGNFWTGLHSFLDFGDEPTFVLIFATLLVNDELFALVHCPAEVAIQTSLFRAKGFGSEDENIVWEKQNCPLLPEQLGPPYVDHFMCPIQL